MKTNISVPIIFVFVINHFYRHGFTVLSVYLMTRARGVDYTYTVHYLQPGEIQNHLVHIILSVNHKESYTNIKVQKSHFRTLFSCTKIFYYI